MCHFLQSKHPCLALPILVHPDIPLSSFNSFAAYDQKYPMLRRLLANPKNLDRCENQRNTQSRNRSLPSENTFDLLRFGDLSQESRSWQATLSMTPSVYSLMRCLFAPCATACILRRHSCIPQWLVSQPPRSLLLPLLQDGLLLLVPDSILP